MNIYLDTLQATERRWQRSCCHDGGGCDDADGVNVGDDNAGNDDIVVVAVVVVVVVAVVVWAS